MRRAPRVDPPGTRPIRGPIRPLALPTVSVVECFLAAIRLWVAAILCAESQLTFLYTPHFAVYR